MKTSISIIREERLTAARFIRLARSLLATAPLGRDRVSSYNLATALCRACRNETRSEDEWVSLDYVARQLENATEFYRWTGLSWATSDHQQDQRSAVQ